MYNKFFHYDILILVSNKSIGASAFGACGHLTKVTFISGLTIIGNFMFQMIDGSGNAVSSSLDSISIPSTITSIGSATYLLDLYIFTFVSSTVLLIIN